MAAIRGLMGRDSRIAVMVVSRGATAERSALRAARDADRAVHRVVAEANPTAMGAGSIAVTVPVPVRLAVRHAVVQVVAARAETGSAAGPACAGAGGALVALWGSERLRRNFTAWLPTA